MGSSAGSRAQALMNGSHSAASWTRAFAAWESRTWWFRAAGSESSTTGRFYDENIARRNPRDAVRPIEEFDVSTRALDKIPARLTATPARNAKRRDPPVTGKNCRRHRLAEQDPSDDAVSAPMEALAATPSPDRERLHQYRKTPLEHFRIRQAGVGHVRMNGVGTIEIRSGARTTADRLIVLVPVVAERKVVHGPLRGSHRPESSVESVGDALGRLDVSRDNRGWIPGA